MNPLEVLGGIVEVATQLRDTFTQLVNTITPFVNAISPSTVLAFNQAMASLQATIGSALIGALTIFGSLLREVSGIILPLMQNLQPIITQLADAFANLLAGGVRILVSGLEALTPVFQALADVTTVFLKLLDDLSGLMSAFLKTVGSLLGSFLGGDGDSVREVFKSLADIIRSAIKSFVTLVGTIAVFTGFSSTVKAFSDKLLDEADERDARTSGLTAAAQNPQITDIAALVKQQQQAAFTAQGGDTGRPKSDSDYLREIALALNDAAKDEKTIGDALTKWWDDNVMNSTLGTFLKFVIEISQRVREFFNRRWF